MIFILERCTMVNWSLFKIEILESEVKINRTILDVDLNKQTNEQKRDN